MLLYATDSVLEFKNERYIDWGIKESELSKVLFLLCHVYLTLKLHFVLEFKRNVAVMFWLICLN